MAAVAELEKYPAPGLAFVQYTPTLPDDDRGKLRGTAERIHDVTGRWLECAQTLVLVVDEKDTAGCRDAVELGQRGKAQGLLTIGAVLGRTTSALRETDCPTAAGWTELAASTHCCIHLETPETGKTADRTVLVLHSLTTGLASVCNVQTHIGVDYDDVLTILGEPARLSVGVGVSSGDGRALAAAHAAVADLRPSVSHPEAVQGILIMLSPRPGEHLLWETKLAMNTIRAAFGPDPHCIYSVYYRQLPMEPSAAGAPDPFQVTLFLTSSA